jgi:hypothetical protein
MALDVGKWGRAAGVVVHTDHMNLEPVDRGNQGGASSSTSSSEDIAVVERDGVLMTVGEPNAVERFLTSLDAWEEAADSSLSPAVMNVVGAAAGVAATTQGATGRWVQLTRESSKRLHDLAGTNKPVDGMLSGVIRGDKGRIDKHIKFKLPDHGSINPLMLTNVATMATAMAAAAAEEEMRELIAGIDKKLDQLAADRRSEVVGVTRGVTQVMDEAFTHYRHAGELGNTAWDKVQSVQPQVLGTWHRALDQLQKQMTSLTEAKPTDRDEELQRVNADVLPLWLPILGQCLMTLTRFRVLEQARVDKVEPHLSDSHRELSDQRHHELLDGLKDVVQSVLTGTSAALDVPNRVRVAHPRQVAKMHEHAGQVRDQVLDFASRVDWYLDQSGEWDNKGWKRSIRDISIAGRSALEGATASAMEAAAGSALSFQEKLASQAGRLRKRNE